MTYRFGKVSLANLEQVHPDLARIAHTAILDWDCSITDGARTLAEQQRNVARGVSKTMASKHLPQADGFAHAIDIVPYPIDWQAITRGINAVRKVDPGMQTLEAYAFHGYVLGIAAALGIKVRSGIDWDNDKEFAEHTFIDLPHVELLKP